MQNFVVELHSDPPTGFKAIKAAQSVDLDVTKKLTHKLEINADITTHYNVGLIIGASGSGKTTLAEKIYGKDAFDTLLNLSKPVIEQFPEGMSYDECVHALTGIGLSQVPCWLKPAGALSNGQKARAEAALQMCSDKKVVVIDEFTSVVDRNVAKVMAHCVQKFARKYEKQIVLISCHYDVVDWLNPDWVIDCNNAEYINRRYLWRSFERPEQINFEIAECSRASWGNFSKYHYLSEKMPGGHVEMFGLYLNGQQIGFNCFANYVPWKKGSKKPKAMHFNRLVVHPDYVGLGLGVKFLDITTKIMSKKGYAVFGKFSSIPVYKSLAKSKAWKLISIHNNTGSASFKTGPNMKRQGGFRQKTRTFSFEYVGAA